MTEEEQETQQLSRRDFLAAAAAGAVVVVIGGQSQNAEGAAASILAHNTSKSSLRESFSLSGSPWKLHSDPSGQGITQNFFQASTTEAGWIPARVPGNVQADVEAAHLLPPLWYGAVNPALYDIARQDWWYRTDFPLPAAYRNKRLTLNFEGVDERCKVWLNGQLVGDNAGMNRRFWFDVSAVAKPGQINQLAVQIGRMPEALVPLLINSDGADSGGGTPDWFVAGLNKTNDVLKDLKTPGNWSYDWSTNVWTLGIWKDVHLEATGPVRIDWTRVEVTLDNDERRPVEKPTPESAGVLTEPYGGNTFTEATVHVILEVDSLSDQTVQARVHVQGHGANISKTVSAKLTKGQNRIQTELILEHPALWWPSGQGTQPLYMLDAEILPAASGPASDKSSTRFGVRQLRWVYTEGAPADAVTCYQLLVNGRPVRCLGSGIILPYILPGCGHAHNLQTLRLAKAAGMNLLRINGGGGGSLFDDAWYDLADELGIMVTYEFPTGNCVLVDDPTMMANIDISCRSMIKQSRNHPSIIQYVGGNEMGWARSEELPALQLMQKIAAEESDRIFRATDPEPDNQHGPYWFDILHTNYYTHYNGSESDTMWYGEFGTTSPANLEVWHREIPPASQWPLDDVTDPILIHHNATHAVGDITWLLKPWIDFAFGYPDNLANVVAGGQYIGADGLRYIYDALRRKGKRIGGMTNHCYSEPWPNAAGSYMVDNDGRTLMNYDFLKQALVPISLSLQFASAAYTPETGIAAELFLVSDSPKVATKLRAKWLARDRNGRVFAQNQHTVSIAPLEVKSLEHITLHPPQESGEGTIFIEMRLEDAKGKLLVERVQIFGRAEHPGAFAGLLKASKKKTRALFDADALSGPPTGPKNLAFVGNGAKPATASSSRPEPKHQAANLNDGQYGNEHSWIALEARGWFQIDLGKPAIIGRFKLGRDRTGEIADRNVDYLKLETSLDGKAWQTVFEQSGLTALKGFGSNKSMLVSIAPIQAQMIKATVDSTTSSQGGEACVDEFEVYAPAQQPPAALPQVSFQIERDTSGPVYPVRQTTVQVTAIKARQEKRQEVLDLQVRNTGAMTALFCEPHPLLTYRTDLLIDNKNCFIPPGEQRTISIRLSSPPKTALSLAQTGWRLSTWNADDVTVDPSADVLLSMGRQDVMCREYLGYENAGQVPDAAQSVLNGNRPATAHLPYLLQGRGSVRFDFNLKNSQADRPARLWLYTADQSEETPTAVQISINGHAMEGTLPKGLGIQKSDPAHRAFPATLAFDVAAAALKTGKNTLTVRITGNGWFSWDALHLVRNA